MHAACMHSQDQAAATRKRVAEAAAVADSSKRQRTIGQFFPTTALKAAADSAVADYYYANGLAFNVARSPQLQSMLDAVAAYGPGYKAPTSEPYGPFAA